MVVTTRDLSTTRVERVGNYFYRIEVIKTRELQTRNTINVIIIAQGAHKPRAKRSRAAY